jgi:hypothetical protein
MKKFLFLVAFGWFCSWWASSQIGFKAQSYQLPSKKTTFEAVEIGDVTNDGRNDIVVGSGFYFDDQYDYGIFIYKQNPNGTLASPVKIDYPKSYPGIYDLELGDFNNDGLNDIAICYGTTLGIFYQLQTGGFGPIQTQAGPYYNNGLESGDLNHDGRTDLLGYGDEKFKLYLQNATGGFTLVEKPSKTLYCSKMDIKDMNGDAYDDIVKVYGSKIEILFQKNGGTITKDSSLIYSGAGGVSYDGLCLGDLNNDGRNDLVAVYGGNSGRQVILYQKSNGSLDTLNVKRLPTYDIPEPVSIADLNCDGLNEIVIGHSGWNHISVFGKTATTDFDKYLLFSSIYYYTNFSMAVGDVNGDWKPDVVSVGQNAQLQVLYNSTAPLTFDSIRYEAAHQQIRQDTTWETNVAFLPVPDTATYCKRNDFIRRTTVQRSFNTYYTGDTLAIRSGTLCGNFRDTIVTPYAYQKRIPLQSIVTDSIVNRDSIRTFTDYLELSSDKEGRTFYILANTCWTIRSDAKWVKPSITSGSGNTVMIINADENPTTEPRSTLLTIEGDRVKPVQLTVYQYGAEPTAWSPANAAVLSEKVNNAAIIEVHANCRWELYRDAEWISVDQYSGKGDALLTIRVTPNETDADRFGMVGLFCDGTMIANIPVLQLKKTSKP